MTTSPGSSKRTSTTYRSADHHDVPESPHERVGRSAVTPRQGSLIVHEHVVQDENLLPVRRPVILWIGGGDEQVSEETQVLLNVLPHMRVVPVHARIGHVDLVGEAVASLDGGLGYPGDSVVAVVEAHAMPVDRRGHLDVVGHAHHDRRVLRRLDERTGILTVVAEHHHFVTVDYASDHRHVDVERVSIRHGHDFRRPRFGEHHHVHAHTGRERPDDRYRAFEAREHRHVHVHGDHAPSASHRHPAHVVHVVLSTHESREGCGEHHRPPS